MFAIIGIGVAWLIYFLTNRYADEEDNFVLGFVLSILAVVVGFASMLFANTGGYKPPEEVRTTELVAFAGTQQEVYLVVDSQNNYLYCFPNEYFGPAPDGSTAISTGTISGNTFKVAIIQEDNTVPRIVEYVEKPAPSIWSVGLKSEKKCFVFVIPKDTIYTAASTVIGK